MLQNTFLHLPSVGPRTERRLWEAGCADWESLWGQLRSGSLIREILSSKRQQSLFERDATNAKSLSWIDTIDQSRRAFESGSLSFFCERLKPSDQWRLLPDFIHDATFLDIETTGLSRHHHYVTVIGALNKGRFHQWVWPQRLDKFYELLSDSRLIVTFNGSRFDLPFLRRQFPELQTFSAHVDLVYSARAVGLAGGQKAVEEQLGLRRDEDLQGVDGSDAVADWCAALYGDRSSYSRLLRYNRVDVEMLPRIAAAVCEKQISANPTIPEFAAKRVPATSRVGVRPLKHAELRMSWRDARPSLQHILAPTTATFSVPVVGIDLRASSQRPTGLAVCRGDAVETAILHTDDEILNWTLSHQPRLVSIDAPLCLPAGRQSVSDDSPCRSKGGIVRVAERVLWSRGIRVYPALIRQMQGLTARGILLANALRSEGVEVIESYPGAAQDVLNIPRKKLDESLLAKGLHEFGYRFSGTKSHDELDAITSALVGHFYLANRYDSIGSEEEGFMINPLASSMSWDRPIATRMVASVVGVPGAGKTTLSKAVAAKLGWKHLVLGDALRERAAEDSELRKLLASGNLAPESVVSEIVNETLSTDKDGNFLIDGFPRHAKQAVEIKRLVGEANWKMLYLDVPDEIAVRRITHRVICNGCGLVATADSGLPCGACGSTSWVRRDEDSGDVIQSRLRRFRQDALDVITAIDVSRLMSVDATQEADVLANSIAKWLMHEGIEVSESL